MDLASAHREVGHARLQTHRFLEPVRHLLTHRPDGSSWPRWADTWTNANDYVHGLLGPGRSKNMRAIARRVGVDEDRIERFVRESPWDYDAVQAHLVTHVPTQIRSSKAALVLDDFGLVKKGRHSVGVARQYSGAEGKTGNCQVAVNLTYAAPGKRNQDQATWPLGTRLYLPKAWVEDADHADLREEVALPKDVRFQTKHEIAWTLLERALPLPHAVILADSEYGNDTQIRRRLREQGEAYALGVNPHHVRVIPADTPLLPPGRNGVVHYPADVHARSPKDIAEVTTNWKSVEWTQGTKGPLKGQFARYRARVTEHAHEQKRATDEVAWLLLEQRPTQLKAYLCWGLDEATLEELISHAHLRWTIEQFHREAKGLLGLDRFEGRTWTGWHHHVTLVLLAYAFLAQTRAHLRTHHRPSLSQVAKALVLEKGTQDLLAHHRLDRRRAKAYAHTVLKGAMEWYR